MRKKFLFTLALILSFGLSGVFAQTAKPKSISAGIINGKATSLPKPEYPAAAQAVKAEGAVNVQVTIDENGNVISASAVSGHPLLRQAAEQAARQSKFSPTLLSGQPVRVTGVIVYNFVAPQSISGNEKRLLMMGLGVFLTIGDLIPNDEWEAPEKEDLQEVPQIAEEMLPLTSITKTTSKEKRDEIIKQVVVSLDSKLSGADAWQFEFGKNFGGILLDLQKSKTNTNNSIDESAVKTKLLNMKNAIYTAPPDFPQDVLDKFKELVKFADMENLNSDENKVHFAQLITATLNTISPDSLD